MDQRFLQETCAAFTRIWLLDTLERLHRPLPELVNRDGEALVFCETRFPFLAEHFDEIARRLDHAPGWDRQSRNEHTWLWLTEPQAITNKPQVGMTIDALQDGQRPLSGTLELAPGVLGLTTNSRERAQRGQTVLETLLAGLIGPALSRLQTPEQMLAEHDAHAKDRHQQAPADGIDPEVAAGIIQHTLDQHYRQILDEAIPALGNKTPRQCARSKKGREQVIEWLKHLENNELRRAARQGQAAYDSRWMWDELQLAKYRDGE